MKEQRDAAIDISNMAVTARRNLEVELARLQEIESRMKGLEK